jgi:hypothetical protein
LKRQAALRQTLGATLMMVNPEVPLFNKNSADAQGEY